MAIVRGKAHITKHQSQQVREATLEHVHNTLETAMQELRKVWDIKGSPALPAPLPVAKAPRATRELTPRQKIEVALRTQSLDVKTLARTIGETAERTSSAMNQMVRDELVANVGTADDPTWTWRVGDETTAQELTEVVHRLITERPMSTRELVAATGARFTRVGGAVVAIQRSGAKILDLATHGRAARWFLIPADARDARLEPKREKEKELTPEAAPDVPRGES